MGSEKGQPLLPKSLPPTHLHDPRNAHLPRSRGGGGLKFRATLDKPSKDSSPRMREIEQSRHPSSHLLPSGTLYSPKDFPSAQLGCGATIKAVT